MRWNRLVVGVVASLPLIVAGTFLAYRVSAQSPVRSEFEIVSIKRSMSNTPGGGGRTLPDGSQRMVDMPLRNFIATASPVATREVIGLPDWATTERYDVEVKPPAGSSREQIREMWRTMWADRMKLIAHVEQRERDVYSLVLARADGKLGPDLKPSTLDCSPPAPDTPPPAPPTTRPTEKEVMSRCGMMRSVGAILSGGMKMDGLATSLYGLAGGDVENHTGLDGFYALSLKFSARRGAAPPLDLAGADDTPDIFTALQEQLGLKLERAKKMMPVFVIDHIERPSEN